MSLRSGSVATDGTGVSSSSVSAGMGSVKQNLVPSAAWVNPGLGRAGQRGSRTRVRKKSSICLIASMKCSKSTGLVTNALACSA